MADELYYDIKAATDDRFSSALTVRSESAVPIVVAAERGTRERPDGTFETYERLEFDK